MLNKMYDMLTNRWDDGCIGNDNNLHDLINIAEQNFNEHSSPYRVYITDNRTGQIVFYREKY